MNIGGNDLLVLDTNVLIHWTRQDATGQQLKSSLGLDRRTERPLVPTTVEGEIRGFAKVNRWGSGKLAQLNEIFRELVRIEVGLPEVIECYAEIYALDRQGGHCRLTGGFRSGTSAGMDCGRPRRYSRLQSPGRIWNTPSRSTGRSEHGWTH